MADGAASPDVLENLLAAARDEPLQATIEVPLYTDAYVTGAIEGTHPYEILNLVPVNAPPYAPTLLLRIDRHIDINVTAIGDTDDSRHTGARSLADEMATILSLSMGARIAAGSPTRYYSADTGPRGWATSDSAPRLPPSDRVHGTSRARPRLLPSAFGPTGVQPEVLDLLRRTPPTAATVLVRAARAYRDALWLVEEEPDLAWLLLVTAVEAAAVHHRETVAQSPEALLRSSAPRRFIQALDGVGEGAVAAVAPHLTKFFGSTARFKAFIDDYFPPAPASRPAPPFVRLEWNREVIGAAIAKVYEYRSTSLHAGVPFPAPMCWVPQVLVGTTPAERCLGGGTHGGKWTAEDCPMHFHVFEHIARHTLMAWWRSVALDAEPLG